MLENRVLRDDYVQAVPDLFSRSEAKIGQALNVV